MMKKIVYIACFLLCVSCNQYAAKKEDNAVRSEEFNVEKDGLLDDADTKYKADFKAMDFDVNYINTEIEEKLQANYEAKILAVKHPEFQEAIKEQLEGSNKFNFTLSDSIQTIEIKDIILSGNMSERNDSITTQKVLHTTLINSKYTQKDSVLVVMKRTMIVIDGLVKMNTSFSFESID